MVCFAAASSLRSSQGFFCDVAGLADCVRQTRNITSETKATLRVILLNQPEGGVKGNCFDKGKPATCEAIFARAY